MLPARFCQRCGRERLAGARFCVGCGFEFDVARAHELSPIEPDALPSAPYPIVLRLEQEPRQIRASVVFRLLLALPHLALWLVLMVLSLLVAVLSWPLALALGRLPTPVHRAQSAVLVYVTRVAGYLCLACGRWPPPPWQPAAAYPIAVSVAPPAPLPRLRTLAVMALALPAVMTAVLFGVVATMLAIGGWFAILVTGRLPRTIYDMLDLSLGFQARTLGYFPLLLTCVYPWFEQGPLLLPSRRG